MDFTQAFLFQLKSICSELWSRQAQALALLVSTGESQGAFSWKLFSEYRQWGLLHLLVLSGSQYYGFSNAWLNITQSLQKLFFKQSSPFLSKISLIPVTCFYLSALQSPAPLVRCALLSLFLFFLSPLAIQKNLIVFIVFVFHMTLENFAPSDSAFLSWLAYLSLQFANILSRNPLVRVVFVSALLHVAICLFKEIDFSFRALLIACFSNAICISLYERVLFPCIGYITALAVLLSPLWAWGLSPYYFKDFIAVPLSFILDLAILPVLVANTSFRYTFQE